MKNSYLILLILTVPFCVLSQKKTSLVAGFSKSWIRYPFHEVISNPFTSSLSDEKQFNNYELSVGLQFYNRFNVEVEFGFMNIQDKYFVPSYNNPYSRNVKIINLGLNLNYRFLNDFVVSPRIALGGGFIPYSNINNKNITRDGENSNFLIDVKGYSPYLFNSWKGYAKGQIFLSIKLNNLFFDIGGGVEYMGYILSKNGAPFDVNDFGFVTSGKLTYLFHQGNGTQFDSIQSKRINWEVGLSESSAPIFNTRSFQNSRTSIRLGVNKELINSFISFFGVYQLHGNLKSDYADGFESVGHLLGLGMEFRPFKKNRITPVLGWSALTEIKSNFRNGYLSSYYQFSTYPVKGWLNVPPGNAFSYYSKCYFSTPLTGSIWAGFDIALLKNFHVNFSIENNIRFIQSKIIWDESELENRNLEDVLNLKPIETAMLDVFGLRLGITYSFQLD